MKKKREKILPFLIMLMSVQIYSPVSAVEPPDLVNLSHLDHLYQSIEINDQKMAIIHIYADFPDYRWADAPGEGIACIDDISRAAVVYLNHYNESGEESSVLKARALIDFILYMQAPNGLFYNFIDADLRVNKEHINSRPQANWWTWRAMWALTEAIPCFSQYDPPFSLIILKSVKKVYPAIDSLLDAYPQVCVLDGISHPTWLPSAYGADQASVLLTALINLYAFNPDSALRTRIGKISLGIRRMQLGRAGGPPFGAFLSWKNLWHAWGNSQAYALLRSGELLDDQEEIKSALTEVRIFHSYLIAQNYLSQFSVRLKEASYEMEDIRQYPQRAYEIRPLVWANLQAFQVTGNHDFARQAGEIACWFFGKNPSGEIIYDPATGRCFDGLDDDTKINRNAGAESTIEALLTMQKVFHNPPTLSIIEHYRKTGVIEK